MPHDKPVPRPNSDTGFFWDGCRERELRFQQCLDCGHVRWPPSIVCPACHSSDAGWIRASGKGRVYTFVVCHTAFHPAFEKDVPYVVAVVELEEGPHILSNVTGCNPSAVRCGMPVEVVWDDVADQITLPKFRP